MMAYECDRHIGMHMSLSNVYLEVVGADVFNSTGRNHHHAASQLRDAADPLPGGRPGRARPAAMLLCRTAPMIARLAGRRSPSFVTADGTQVEGYHLIRFVRRAPGVLEFQLIQEAVGRLRLLLMTTPDFDEASLAEARTDIADQMGADCEVVVEQVARIPRPPSGKAQMLISKLAPTPD
jgi:phenylacetate-coenzyme A ligase PaaK-like adenylate-forming protein